MSIPQQLSTLFHRDLGRLNLQIETFSTSESLWQTLPGITNSAGNLTLHIEGNLREYIGRQLGNRPYTRQRPLEFSAKDVSQETLLARIAELQLLIPPIIEELSQEQLESVYPEVVLERAVSTQEFLIHLYGHLNFHLGQINYLRRIVDASRLD